MRKLQELINNKSNRYILIILIIMAATGLLFIRQQILISSSETTIPFLDSIYKAYLIIPEWFANQIFRIREAPVTIINHELVYENPSSFQIGYEKYLTNWPKYLLYKNWSILVLGLIWIYSCTIKKKLLGTFFFILVHISAVVGGLYLMGIVYPNIPQDKIDGFLKPNLVGSLLFYLFIAGWILLNSEDLKRTLLRFKINYQPSIRQIHEIVALPLLFLILREFLIPYFQFKPYATFLLGITKYLSAWLGYPGYIDGHLLIGESGSLFLGKACLGLVTLLLFVSFVFLTRKDIPNKVTILYILSGLIFLSFLNIIRLVAIFIIAQGENGVARASVHHEIYNIVIYIFVFALWVLWYERFVRRAKKAATP